MESFGKQYAFRFCCHEVNHSNRKAGEERSFWTVETNFFPGRSFASLEDLNAQALEWSTVRMEQRPQGKVRLIPAKAFEFESTYLTKLPDHLPAPYVVHERGTDQYGYVAFDGNFYWVPGTARGEVKVLQYASKIALYRGREFLAEYALPADGVKNKPFTPPGMRLADRLPRHRKPGTEVEERELRAISDGVSAYLDFALADKGIRRHEFLRQLARLSRRMTPELFTQSVTRALKYRIATLDTVERIALLQLGEPSQAVPVVEIDDCFLEREAYREGALTELPDFTSYDRAEEEQGAEEGEDEHS